MSFWGTGCVYYPRPYEQYGDHMLSARLGVACVQSMNFRRLQESLNFVLVNYSVWSGALHYLVEKTNISRIFSKQVITCRALVFV